MHTLHAVVDPSKPGNLFGSIKGIKVSRGTMGLNTTLKEARIFWDSAKKAGYVYLGDSEDLEAVHSAANSITDLSGGCLRGVVDATNEELSLTPPPATQAATDRPAVLAAALMSMSKGDPLVGAAYGITLARVTGDEDKYRAAIQILVQAFPWIEEVLVKSELWESA